MTPRLRRIVATVTAALSAVTLTACEPNRFITGWVPHWNGTAGRAVIDESYSASLLGEVSLFWYSTATGGTLTRLGTLSSLQSTVASLRAQGLPVVPTITDGTAAGVMSTVIHDPTTRTAHVQRIVDLVTTNGYDGIDIDYEVFAFGQTGSWSTIKPDWVAFVQELGTALHSVGKLLSVTVPPTYVDGSGRTRGYTVYAQDQIASSVDRLRLMAYDWSTKNSAPGSVGYPLSVLRQVISYSSGLVPVSKLQLGVPAYGRHWTSQKFPADACPSSEIGSWSVTIANSAALIAESHVTPTRHDGSGELTFTWEEVLAGSASPPAGPPGWVPPTTTAWPTTAITTGGLQSAVRVSPQFVPPTCTIVHTVFVPDATTIRQTAQLVLDADWSGIAIWALGYESPEVYAELLDIAPQRPNGSPVVVLDTPVVTGTNLAVTGHAYDPEYDLPVPVRIRITKTGTGVVATRVVTARVSRGSMPAGLGPNHGYAESFTLGAGTYDVCVTRLEWGGADGNSATCRSVTVTG